MASNSQRSLLQRLHSGERWWAAEVVVRALGLALLAACYQAAITAHNIAPRSPMQQPTSAEFADCALAFVLLFVGLAFTFEGPRLFRLVPIPARSVMHWNK